MIRIAVKLVIKLRKPIVVAAKYAWRIVGGTFGIIVFLLKLFPDFGSDIYHIVRNHFDNLYGWGCSIIGGVFGFFVVIGSGIYHVLATAIGWLFGWI